MIGLLLWLLARLLGLHRFPPFDAAGTAQAADDVARLYKLGDQ